MFPQVRERQIEGVKFLVYLLDECAVKLHDVGMGAFTVEIDLTKYLLVQRFVSG